MIYIDIPLLPSFLSEISITYILTFFFLLNLNLNITRVSCLIPVPIQTIRSLLRSPWYISGIGCTSYSHGAVNTPNRNNWKTKTILSSQFLRIQFTLVGKMWQRKAVGICGKDCSHQGGPDCTHNNRNQGLDSTFKGPPPQRHLHQQDPTS